MRDFAGRKGTGAAGVLPCAWVRRGPGLSLDDHFERVHIGSAGEGRIGVENSGELEVMGKELIGIEPFRTDRGSRIGVLTVSTKRVVLVILRGCGSSRCRSTVGWSGKLRTRAILERLWLGPK